MSKKTTFIATGDTFITRRVPKAYPGFRQVKQIIEQYDCKFANLEMTFHDHEGYPAAFSGGTWAMASPAILDDVQEYGFNIYNTANNHSHDYSHGGLLATIKHLQDRQMIFAGTGKHLGDASRPAYLECDHARVALIAASSSFHESGAAGAQSADMQGRPGLNPLRYVTRYHVEQKHFDALQQIAQATTINAALERGIKNGYRNPPAPGTQTFGGLSFVCSDKNGVHTHPLPVDMERIAGEIEEARKQADYVLVSIHAHEADGADSTKPAEFLRIFAHNCIDAGADGIIGHGPHELRGIEIYNGKPIFYSLGNFIFQTETVDLQPADAYINRGMPLDTKVGAYMDNRSKNGTAGYGVLPEIWLSVMAGWTMEDGKLTEIQLYPVTLNMEMPRSRKGLPVLLQDNEVLNYLADLSAPFGTEIEVRDGVGYIRFSD